ncbi:MULTISPECIES: RDD family protein [unclassified Kribbella]|uniref:RDD family protein n=1 Tax=unclassified Kribbella TaxID=2644121 RepID=UPI00301641A2
MSFPAGWYDDPQDQSQQRYWDGSAWTDNRRPRQGPPPYQGQYGQPAGERFGQPAQHGQVYGGAQPGPAGQYGGQPQAGQPYPPYPQQTGQGYGYPGLKVHATPDGQPLSGWWRRVFARVIDGIIVGIIGLPFTGYFYWQYFQVVWAQMEEAIDAAAAGATAPGFQVPAEAYQWMIPAVLIGLAVGFVYEYLFLTRSGATLGKKALGIAVRLRDVPGPPPGAAVAKRVGFDTAISMLSVIPLIGTLFSFLGLINYLWPLWDDKKQALHDKVAGTNVVRT